MARFIRYKKYVPEPASEMSMEDLVGALSDYLLQSGFQQQYMDFYDLKDAEQTLDDLRQAIAEALLNSDVLDQQMREQIENMSPEQMEDLIEQLIERMEQENYINVDQPHDPSRSSTAGGQVGDAQSQARFEITDKGLDFLGFRALRDLLGSLGKSNFGRHDTRDTATGIETSGASKTYEFGDTLNLDITATLSSAIQREGLHLPLNTEYSDLQVHQCEYQSSCATVLMIDISHSMILYGEDRITPAKNVAMAMAELIKRKYPKDTLDIIVFGDDAWKIEVKDLPFLQVGPYHTNTVAGLELAMDLLRRRKNVNKQIFMITDGKPTCLKEHGSYYKNSFGLDRKILNRTLNLAGQCRRLGIKVTTFMVASD